MIPRSRINPTKAAATNETPNAAIKYMSNPPPLAPNHFIGYDSRQSSAPALPGGDPADITDASSAADAFAHISKAEAPFASRADESGTNTKELSLWEAAGIKPHGSWYVETGQGMGQTLTIASQKQAYTLSERGTFLATKNLDLELLLEGGKDLLNPYHVIVVQGD